MKKYEIFIRVYSIWSNSEVVKTKIVETDDVYSEIGKIYCNSLEEITRIDYREIMED